jgi:hypothetical protein
VTRAIVLLLTATAVSAVSCSTESARQSTQSVEERRFQVVEESQVHRLWGYLAGCNGTDTAGLSPAWTPSDALVSRIEPMLRVYADSALASRGSSLRGGDYFIHYYGVYRDSQVLVIASAVARRLMLYDTVRALGSDSADVRPQLQPFATPLIPCDAGPAYFRAVTDTTARTVLQLDFGSPM